MELAYTSSLIFYFPDTWLKYGIAQQNTRHPNQGAPLLPTNYTWHPYKYQRSPASLEGDCEQQFGYPLYHPDIYRMIQ